jgi:superfamily II DNA or RNA helicase
MKDEIEPAGIADFVASNSMQQDPRLANMSFKYPLRKYQKEILALVDKKLRQGEKEIHIVAPPGAGKTIIGLQLISLFKCPSLVLCPNTTIQSQWGQKVDLFLPPELADFGTADLIGTHEDKPLKPVTMLTYQVLSTPGREQEYIEKLAHDSWIEELTAGRALSSGEAEIRVLEILQNNPRAHQKEISRHASRLRRRLTEVLDLKDVLHPNAINLLQALRRQQFRLVIFDECHHLTDYWAAIMTHLVNYLGDCLVIGLTGTPPEGKSASQETRYLSLVGEIDYQVPTPALVKEGGLAPFQDLVYFTEPTAKELLFLQEQHQEFHKLIYELIGPDLPPPVSSNITLAQGSLLDPFSPVEPAAEGEQEQPRLIMPPLPDKDANKSQDAARRYKTDLTNWIVKRVEDAIQLDVVKFNTDGTPVARAAILTKAKAKSTVKETTTAYGGWKHMQLHNTELAIAFCRYFWKLRIPFPRNIEQSEALHQSPMIEDWMLLLEDYASQKLKLSRQPDDHKLYERIRSAARKLGYGITEQGLRKQASPVDRVLAFSNSKPQAVAKILEVEFGSLQDRLRAVVVTDFERMSATNAKALDGVLDVESGGAIATLRTLLADKISDVLNPCLVTGSLLLTDKRIASQFVSAARELIKEQGLSLELTVKDLPNTAFSEITSGSCEWESRLYVGIATAIFERGITKCLIGTRGLFGEGWDSQSLNTLIDLTTTTSPVSVKQLRGRSIRIQTNDPIGARKVANNWDVVCIAPSLEKGLNDYHRFVRKHDGYFGICDDGQIECGVGHVHPSFSELTPVEVFASAQDFNEEMIGRALVRDGIYELWKVGQPYKNTSLGCVEVSRMRKQALTPPYIRKSQQYASHAKELRAHLIGVWGEYAGLGAISSAVLGYFLATWGGSVFAAGIPLVCAMILARKKYISLYTRLKKETCKPNTQESSLIDVATAVMVGLQLRKLLPEDVNKSMIKVSMRSDGSYRVFLDEVEPEQSTYFINSFREVMAPITNQPYLIPKYEYFIAGDEAEQIKLLAEQTPEQSKLIHIHEQREDRFFKAYLSGKAQPRIAAYHPVPSLLARSEKGREAFEAAWNKYVSPGSIVATETKPELLNRYFGIGPSLAQRLLWE